MPPDWWLVELIEGADWMVAELEAIFMPLDNISNIQ